MGSRQKSFEGKSAFYSVDRKKYLTAPSRGDDSQGVAMADNINPSSTFILYFQAGAWGIFQSVFQLQLSRKYLAVGKCVPPVLRSPGMCRILANADFTTALEITNMLPPGSYAALNASIVPGDTDIGILQPDYSATLGFYTSGSGNKLGLLQITQITPALF
jgi:hypothetical protein